MADKTSKVLSALKERGSVGETKKGVHLLGIVKKLSEKRKMGKMHKMDKDEC